MSRPAHGRSSAAEITVRLDGSFPATTRSVAQARGLLDRLAAEVGIPEEQKAELKLALSEACTNAVLHGSPRGGQNSFYVCCELRGHYLILEVRDEGHGFDYRCITLPPPEEIEGGRGIYLMQHMVDDLEFDRQPGGMVVRLFKRIDICCHGNSGL
jgi:serine/threonine-protein kinase RsbW